MTISHGGVVYAVGNVSAVHSLLGIIASHRWSDGYERVVVSIATRPYVSLGVELSQTFQIH